MYLLIMISNETKDATNYKQRSTASTYVASASACVLLTTSLNYFFATKFNSLVGFSIVNHPKALQNMYIRHKAVPG